MNGFAGDTVHIICSIESVTTNKRDKEIKLKEIIAGICALLNSKGGCVVLDIDSQGSSKGRLSSSQASTVIRILEQTMISITGIQLTVSNIHFKEDKERIVIFVKNADSVITTNYNLYLPSQTQVVLLSTLEPVQNIINSKLVLQVVPLHSYQKIFVKGKNCDFQESKTVQFRYLKSDASKRTTLADRISGKGNKFNCYVSAFANYRGGHIYYGIADDGIVQGQIIPSEEDKNNITKKVEKVINKMIWPELIGQPKRGERWEISFEPVVEENSKPIPSTFVIVIYIAPCLGGVFTEEPECYEMVDGKVEKMSFSTWKRKILVGDKSIFSESNEPCLDAVLTDEPESRWLSWNKGILQCKHLPQPDKMPPELKRITWHSTSIQNICTFADHELTQSVNTGKGIDVCSWRLETQFPELIEVKLVVLSKKVMNCYRSGSFIKAQELIKKYDVLLPKATDVAIFDAIRAYIATALQRAKEDIEVLSTILPSALEKAELIPPGLITAAIYLLAATVTNITHSNDDQVSKPQGYSSYALSILALEHLKHVQDSPVVRADLEQKTHITLALFHLGCNTSGALTKKHVDSKSLDRAESSVTAVLKLIDDGYPLNHYREVQFKSVKSILSYRYSQVQVDRKLFFLKEAFNFSKDAETLASEYHFEEMLNWARACMALCTEGLLRAHFKSFKSRSSDVAGMITSDSKLAPKATTSEGPPNDDFLANVGYNVCEKL